MQKMKRQGGFTLIEMVIVIAVVGILMGIAFNGIRGVQSSARDTKRVADLRSVQSYLELYFNKCGHYPGNSSCEVADIAEWNVAAGGGLKQILESTVANSGDIPDDPFSTRSGTGAVHYEYETDANNAEYVIGAMMEKTPPRGGATGTIHGLDCTESATNKIYCVRS
jgi:general secretion pathway protein G